MADREDDLKDPNTVDTTTVAEVEENRKETDSVGTIERPVTPLSKSSSSQSSLSIPLCTQTSTMPSSSSVLHTTFLSLHRSSLSPEKSVRMQGVESLLLLTQSQPLLVLDTWEETFVNLNNGESGINFGDYASKERVRSLSALDKIVAKLVSNRKKEIDKDMRTSDDLALKTCIGRVISLTTEEMTRYPEVVPDIQKPCSQCLTFFGQLYMERVMDALLLKFQPNALPHYYVVHTLSNLAVANSTAIVPFVKVVLGTLVAHVKTVKKDNMKYAFAGAFGRLSEAIEEYLSSNSSSIDRSVSPAHFLPELDNGHEHLFASWLTSSRDLKVKHAVLDALGSMSNLLSEERLRTTTSHMLVVLLATYKRTPEPFFVTQCLSKLIRAVVNLEATILDSSAESLLAALFLQICEEQQQQQSSYRPLSRKNSNEVLRCYDSLIASHKDKLLTGLIIRLNNVDENVRLASLTILKHLMTTSMNLLEDRLEDINECLHNRIKGDVGSLRVKKMLAQIVAQLGRLGCVDKALVGRDYVEFIVRLCALDDSNEEDNEDNRDDEDKDGSSDITNVVTNGSVRRMSDQILLLLAKNVPQMEPLLWPNLLQYLVLTDYHRATGSIVRAMALLAEKKSSDKDFIIDYNDQSNAIPGPHSILSRIVVIASLPESKNNANSAISALTFLLHFAPNISKHVQALWQQRIPLLLHYLQSQQTLEIDQWQEWLMTLIEDTVVEIDLEDWNHALLREMSIQLHFPFLSSSSKCFLIATMGSVLKLCTNRSFISDQLNLILNSISNSSSEQKACAMAFGKCAKKHLGLVQECLEAEIVKVGRMEQQKKGFFSSLLPRDKQSDETKVQERKSTIIQCIGEVALSAPINELETALDSLTLKFLMPFLRSNKIYLRIAALSAVMKLATAIEPDKLGGYEITLVHHDDIVDETINALKSGDNDAKMDDETLKLKEKALLAMSKMVLTKPWLCAKTRLALLKASFDALFNNIRDNDDKEKTSIEDNVDGQSVSKTKLSSTASLSTESTQVMVEALDILVSTLMKQSLLLSTLDEMFTLIEPWLKKSDCQLTRAISIRLLHTALDTYGSNIEFKVGQPTSFSPGPYILGSVIPRCFDVPNVQEWALKCQQMILKILAMYDGHIDSQDEECNSDGMKNGHEDEERSMMKRSSELRRSSDVRHLSTLSSSLSSSVEALSRTSTPLVSLLVQRVLPHQLVPLVHSLIDSLNDSQLSCARGTALVLEDLLNQRGHEVYSHIEDLVQRFQCQLHSIKDLLTMEQTLKSLHILAKLDSFPIVNTLIALSNGDKGDFLPLNESLTRVWQALGKNPVGTKVVNHLITIVANNINEDKDMSKKRECTRSLLVALAALTIVFETRVDDVLNSANDDDENDINFAHVFVVLIASLRNLLHVSNDHTEIVKRKGSNHTVTKDEPVVKEGPVAKLKKSSLSSFIHKDKHGHTNNNTSIEHEGPKSGKTDTVTSKATLLPPFDVAKATLVSFLKSQGCVPLDKIALNIPSDKFNSSKTKDLESSDVEFDTLESFGSECIAPLLISVLLDFPQLFKDLMTNFEGLLSKDKKTATVFFAQLLLVLGHEKQLKPAGRELHGHAQQAARFLLGVVQDQTKSTDDSDEGEDEDSHRSLSSQSSSSASSRTLLLLSLLGLSSFETLSLSIREDVEDDMGSRGLLQSILSTFLALVGEDFRSGLNYHTLKGLKHLIESSVEGRMEAENQRRLLIEVVTKIRPFFDSATKRESREAIDTFGKLALVVENNKEAVVIKHVFIEHVHSAMVSLLLHANDDRDEVRQVSVSTLLAIAPNLFDDDHEEKEVVRSLQAMGRTSDSVVIHEDESDVNKNFVALLRNVATSEVLKEMLVVYIDQCLNFFISPCSSRLRCNAALAVCSFVCDGGVDNVDLDRVCVAFNALLEDPEKEVQATASLAVGKVVVALCQRQEQARAEQAEPLEADQKGQQQQTEDEPRSDQSGSEEVSRQFDEHNTI